MEAAKKRVGGIEAALAALAAVVDTDSPEVNIFRQSLQKAKRAATDRPLKEQLCQNEAFIERSRRRISDLDAERAADVLELEKAEERTARLVEAIATEEVPVDRQDPVTELENLRAKVAHLEAAKARRSEQGSVEAWEKHSARAVKRRAGF